MEKGIVLPGARLIWPLHGDAFIHGYGGFLNVASKSLVAMTVLKAPKNVPQHWDLVPF